MIHFNETSIGDEWQACVTPNDGTEDGAKNCSNNLTVLDDSNKLPVISGVELNSTFGTNYTTENLTVYWDVADGDEDNVTNITNWYVDGKSITVLNMPFEGGTNSTHAKDYSGYGNNATLGNSDPYWNASGGFNGKGVVQLDGNDYFKVTYDPTLALDSFSVEAWAYPELNDPGSYGAHIVSRWSNVGGNKRSFALVQGSGTREFLFQISEDGTTSNMQTVTTTFPSIEQWYHVVATYNGSHMKIYVDGSEGDSALENTIFVGDADIGIGNVV